MKIRIKNKRSTGVAFAMSDIAFLLLIFLVITASINESGEVVLPSFAYVQEDQSPVNVNVALEKEGRILVEGNEIALLALSDVIRSKYPGDQVVVRLYADEACRFEQVDSVLSHLKDGDFLKILLAAEESNQ